MNCPNCNTEIKNGFLKSNKLVPQDTINLINDELNLKAESYCNSCGDELYKQAKKRYDEKQSVIEKERNDLRLECENIKSKLLSRIKTLNYNLNYNIENIPILTTHTPYGWQYTSLGLVSGQIVTGTGVISEIFSDVTDFFGAKSNSFTNKLTKSEEVVLNQLRAKAVLQGGNAVIAIDIDYADVGTGKGMLMVCGAGTAIILNNIDVLGSNKKKMVNDISSWQNEKIAIETLLLDTNEDIMEEYKKFIVIYNAID